jgi:hypothetical protein
MNTTFLNNNPQSSSHSHSQSHFSPLTIVIFHTKQTIPGYVPPLCTSIPASTAHAQSSMHKPQLPYSPRSPTTVYTKRNPHPAGVCPRSRADPITSSKHAFHWRKLGLGPLALFARFVSRYHPRPRKIFWLANQTVETSWLSRSLEISVFLVDGEVVVFAF